MYCPRCGQQQVTEDLRFCSRCGMPLSGLGEWLTSGGPPAWVTQENQLSKNSPRRKGIRRGAKVMFFSGAVFPVFLLMAIAADEPVPLFFPIIAFLVGLTITLYSLIFIEESPAFPNQQPRAFGSGPQFRAAELPPASSTPIYGPGNLTSRVRTNELAQPPSVTENTTKLLDNE